MIDKEIWKSIKNFEGKYLVSNLGNVFSNHIKRNLKLQNNKHGYIYCNLSIKKGSTKYSLIHRLVAEAFIPNPENKPEVNHIDGNKKNNSVDNLEWVTSKENIDHAFKNNLRNSKTLIKNGEIKSKKVYQLDINTKEILRVWNSAKQIKRELNYDDSYISLCCKLRKISYKGFIWRYEETLNENRDRKKTSARYKVVLLEEGKVINEFNSVDEVAKYFSINRNSVYRALNNNRKFLNKFNLIKKIS